MKRCCHYCNQELPAHRLGVKLTPTQGRIFDLVCEAGENGINRHDIADITGTSPDAVKVHINHINERLRDRGYHIRGYGNYRLVQWKGAAA